MENLYKVIKYSFIFFLNLTVCYHYRYDLAELLLKLRQYDKAERVLSAVLEEEGGIIIISLILTLDEGLSGYKMECLSIVVVMYDVPHIMHNKDLSCRFKKKSHFNHLKSPKMFRIYPTFHTFKWQSKVILFITFLPHFYTFICIIELVLILNMHQIFAAERSNWQKKIL